MATYPNINFSDVGGNESFKSHFKERYSSQDYIKLWQEMKTKEITSFLLHGPEGCGKSLLAHSVAGEYQLPLVSVTATELTGGNPEANVQDLFHQATKLAPCILLIENIDHITAKRNIATSVMENKICIQLAVSIHDLRCKSSPVLVICTSNRPDLLDTTFRTKCFNIEHAVRIPNKCSRESILQVLCKKQHLADDVSLSEIAGLTCGYVGSDLKSLISLTITYAVHRVVSEHELQRESLMMDCGSTGEGNSRQKDTLCEEMDRLSLTNVDIQNALVEVKPSLYREDWFVFSNITWDDLGGIDNIQRELKLDLMNFQDEVRRPELYGTMGIRVLLYGPSGCGKTSIAMAIANNFEMNLLYVRGEELLSKMTGQSEDNIRVFFKRAKSLTPCLIFIDEIDILCPNMSSESHERSINNATTQLLLECLLLTPGSEIYVLAATNNLDELDPELLEVCRINRIINVELPGPEERVEILRILTKGGTSPKLAEDVNLDCIGRDRRCDSFSGKDLNMLVQKACEACLMQNFESPEAPSPCGIPLVNKTHFDKAFESIYYYRCRGQENP